MKKKSFQTSELINIFPYYKFDDLFPFNDERPPFSGRIPTKNCYQEFCISIFEHPLTEEAFSDSNILITYYDFNRKRYYYRQGNRKYSDDNTNRLWTKYTECENQWISFFKALYKKGVYMILSGRDLIEFTGEK